MKIKALILILAIVAVSIDLQAQCAMCRAVAESNNSSGGSIGAGLNSGILYLMAIPYLAFMAAFFYLFKKKGYKIVWDRGPKIRSVNVS
ncbi:MAG: hypothetical protein MRY83_22745 [Flavobacteriales bacterium]|nr:hypothetical protein [Flavobacteriales bacterium]